MQAVVEIGSLCEFFPYANGCGLGGNTEVLPKSWREKKVEPEETSHATI